MTSLYISLQNTAGNFRPWLPTDGQVFQPSSTYALDCRIIPPDATRPSEPPMFVLAAAWDGRQGYFLERDHIPDFLIAHRDVPVAMHDAPVALAVLQHLLGPRLDLYASIDRGLIWDILLLHRLYMLARTGDSISDERAWTLGHLAEQYLQGRFQEPKDQFGYPVASSYGRWLHSQLDAIDPLYLAYAAVNSMAIHSIFGHIKRLTSELLGRRWGDWGYVSENWLVEQVRLWGPQTHHIQLRAAVVLKEVTALGLRVDLDRVEALKNELIEADRQHREVLQTYGYVPGQSNDRDKVQEILRKLQSECGILLPRTPGGLLATGRDTLGPALPEHPFVQALVAHQSIQHTLSNYLNKMDRPRLHPTFDILKVTGRSSSFGDISSQNLPRDDRVRSCIVASPGHVLIRADYAQIELVTLAEAIVRQFGLRSHMAEAINQGQDLHILVASRVLGKPMDQVTSEERNKAKAINYGKPGGMGNDELRDYARKTYGVSLTPAEVGALSDSWFELFPEMRVFLGYEGRMLDKVARIFELTPAAFPRTTRELRGVLSQPRPGEEDLPDPRLAAMFLEVLRTGQGLSTQEEIDIHWQHAQAAIPSLDAEVYREVCDRRPSQRLVDKVVEAVEATGVYTLTGRLRGNADYCARHNSIFQGLASDGAKIALWHLWRAGYRVCNFVHDEVLVEVPADSNLREHADRISQLMILGMQAVVPDVAVRVEVAAMEKWYKAARAAYDDQGNLLVWRPEMEQGHS